MDGYNNNNNIHGMNQQMMDMTNMDYMNNMVGVQQQQQMQQQPTQQQQQNLPSLLIPPNTLSNSMNTFNSIIDDGSTKKRKVKNEDGTYTEVMGTSPAGNSYLDTFQQLQQHQQQLNSFQNQYNSVTSPQTNTPSSPSNSGTFQLPQPQSQLMSSSLYPIPSISITTTSSTPNNGNPAMSLSPRGGHSPSHTPSHSPLASPHHSPVHSPLLHSDNYLSLNDNESSDPLSPLLGYSDRDPPFQWNHYQQDTWYTTLNTNGEEMPVPQLQIIASKGFSYVNNSWVYCRRNHFQLDITASYPKQTYDGQLSSSSSNIDPTQTPSYLLIDGVKTPINGLTLTIKGIKNRVELSQPELEVELFQTNSKREKQGEHAPKPVAIQFGSLVSIQRLHFRKATLNNARRNGQPNPHQEYNQLVVSLWGRCMAQEYCIVSYISPPLIVRTAISSPSVSPAATDLSPQPHTPEPNHPSSPFNTFGSNLNTFPDFSSMRLQSPGHSPRPMLQLSNNLIPNASTQINNNIPANFNTTKVGGCEWVRGEADKTIIYNGKVGINVDNPTFALSVQGTIYASEGVYHPSDLRIKYDIKQVDTKKNLDNVNRMKVYDYKLHPEWVYMNGMDPYDNADRGVIAQELYEILPNSVRTVGNRVINGQEIENLLVIKNQNLVFENIGATQELSKQVEGISKKMESYEHRIQFLERSRKRCIFIIVLLSVFFVLLSIFTSRTSRY